MLGQFDPTNPTQWIALLAALIPLVVWAGSGFVRGLVMLSQRREQQWRRLHELASALYNKEGASGAWVQFLAAQELKRLRTRRKEAKMLANKAADHFSSKSPNDPETAALIAELRKFGR